MNNNMQLIEPQPIIEGSYIQDGPNWHVCDKPDIDRMFGPPPTWKTLLCPFGEFGTLTSVDGKWFWKKKRTKNVRLRFRSNSDM